MSLFVSFWYNVEALVWTYYKHHNTLKKKYWIRSDLLTVFWVSRFKQNTNIPIGNYFPGLAWKKDSNAWILLKKNRPKSRALKRKENLKIKQNRDTQHDPWTAPVTVSQHSTVSLWHTVLTLFINEKILVFLFNSAKRRERSFGFENMAVSAKMSYSMKNTANTIIPALEVY